jgi:membrane protein implicated in regulation of membrane protease activity
MASGPLSAMPPSPLFWLLVATGLWLLVLLGLDGDGVLLVGGSAALLPPKADQAQVISAFNPDGSGRVQWQGQSWAALNVDPHTPLNPGERVTVMGRDGNCLQVMARKSP